MLKNILKLIIEKRKDFTYDRILSKYGLLHAKSIPSWTTREELHTLYQHARKINKGAYCLEIGSYLGASTSYIGAGIAEKNGTLICVDTWNNETMPEGEMDTFVEFCKNTQPISKYIRTIRNKSSELLPEDFPEKFDFIFIDGDHSYESVKSDFELVTVLTRKKSKVFFHDSVAYEGVTKVIGEALVSGLWQIGGSINNLFWIIKK